MKKSALPCGHPERPASSIMSTTSAENTRRAAGSCRRISTDVAGVTCSCSNVPEKRSLTIDTAIMSVVASSARSRTCRSPCGRPVERRVENAVVTTTHARRARVAGPVPCAGGVAGAGPNPVAVARPDRNAGGVTGEHDLAPPSCRRRGSPAACRRAQKSRRSRSKSGAMMTPAPISPANIARVHLGAGAELVHMNEPCA